MLENDTFRFVGAWVRLNSIDAQIEVWVQYMDNDILYDDYIYFNDFKHNDRVISEGRIMYDSKLQQALFAIEYSEDKGIVFSFVILNSDITGCIGEEISLPEVWLSDDCDIFEKLTAPQYCYLSEDYEEVIEQPVINLFKLD